MILETTTIFIIGRVLFTFFLLFFGFSHLVSISKFTKIAKRANIPFPKLIVFFTGVLFLLSSFSFIFWVYIDLALRYLVVFFILSALTVHKFWSFSKKDEYSSHLNSFISNIFIASILMILSLFII